MRISKIGNLLERFEEIQLEIDILDPEPEDGNDDQSSFEKQFCSLVSIANKLVSDFTSPLVSATHYIPQPDVNVGGSNTVLGSTRLPNLELPKFNGNFEKWSQFFETFQTLVHNNQHLDTIQKFYYLLDSLEGPARELLDCLEIKRDNYAVALGLLENRYQNKPVIIQKHIKALVDMPPVSNALPNLSRTINDSIEKHVRALKALGEPVEQWDRLLIFILSRKLEIESKKEWEEIVIFLTSS